MLLALPELYRDLMSGLPPDLEIRWFTGRDEAIAAVPHAEVMWTGSLKPAEIRDAVEAGHALRWVHTHGAGTENHPLAVYKSREIAFTNGSGVGAVPISEYVVMMMLAAVKGLPDLVRAQDRREWLSRGPTGPRKGELFGSRALIIGYGAIGRAIAARLRPFGVDVTGVRRRAGQEPSVIGDPEWRERIGEFDWVILATILTKQTRDIIGRHELEAMRGTAWLVNIGRGRLVDQTALVEALRNHRIGGAYLDVMDPEPLPSDHELWGLDNVILSPHSSWSSPHFHERSADQFLSNLLRYLAGEQLQNLVDLDVGHRVT